MITGINFRTAALDEVALMLDWAAKEGWNPGIEDANAFHAADPAGFFVAVADGMPVAVISIVNHCPEMAFLGLYICRSDWRGRGIGYALWTHALAHAGSRSVALDGVSAQEANYAKSGFVRTGATVRFEGRLESAESKDVRALRADDLASLHQLDAQANGLPDMHFSRHGSPR